MEDEQLLADVQRLTDGLRELPEPVAEPVFIAVSGLPGTGKSYVSRRLLERLPLIILESDALRKALFSSPDYSQRESSRLFRACHYLIEALLKRGISLVLDATNLSEQHREYLYSIADRLNVKLLLVRVEAPSRIVRQRLDSRLKNPENKSDADWAVYQKMRNSAEKIGRRHYVLDTSRDINPVLDKIVKEVNR